MLIFEFTDTDDNIVYATNPVAVCINMQEDIPCDDMTALFPYFASRELKSVVVRDGQAVVFTGIVDEQKTISTTNGNFTEIVSRSMASLLTDNESMPVSYNNISTQVLCDRHVKPYGISYDTNDNRTFFGVHTVRKGSSDWQVVEDFSKNVYNGFVRVNQKGELSFCADSDDEVVFSNDGDGIEYSSFSENIRRCDEISAVKVKVTNSDGYNTVFENKDAIKRSVLRNRYVNSVMTSTPVATAQQMINKSKQKAYSVELICNSRQLHTFLKNASVKNSLCKDIDNMYVSSLRYTLDKNKEITTITLKRKENRYVA